jgi:hypothetical protein
MRSGLLHSSHPHSSICAALARQAQVGVGEMPSRFSSFDNSVPGPLVGGAGVSGWNPSQFLWQEHETHCTSTPQTVHLHEPSSVMRNTQSMLMPALSEHHTKTARH